MHFSNLLFSILLFVFPSKCRLPKHEPLGARRSSKSLKQNRSLLRCSLLATISLPADKAWMSGRRRRSRRKMYIRGETPLCYPLPPLPPSYCSCSSCMFQFPFKHSKLEVRDAYENSKQKKVYPVTIFDRAHIAASKNLGHCHWDVEAWCCDRSQCELTSATGHMGCIPLGLRPQATWDVRPQAV